MLIIRGRSHHSRRHIDTTSVEICFSLFLWIMMLIFGIGVITCVGILVCRAVQCVIHLVGANL